MSEERLTAEEQAQLDAMRDADAQSGSEQAPAVEPGAAAEPPADPAKPPPPAPQRTVPLAALHEERERRKQAEKDREADRAQMRTLEERTNLLLQRFGQPQPAEQNPPDPVKSEIPPLDKDPVGHIIGTQQDLRRQFDQQQVASQQWNAQLQQQLQAQQAVNMLTQRAQALEHEFTIEHPDYSDAVRHLTAQRHKELELIGFLDPAERHTMIQQEGLLLAARSIQTRRNPAAAIYELAKQRGFAPPAAASDPPSQPTAEQRIQSIAAGQQQARSLGNARGTGTTTLTAQSLAAMTDKEFEKMLETPEGMALLGA